MVSDLRKVGSIIFLGFSLLVQARSSAQTSIFPIGGQCGTSFEAEVLEANMKGPFGIQFDSDELEATVRQENNSLDGTAAELEAGASQEKDKKDTSRIFLDFKVSPKAAPGIHVFQMISAEGLSRRLTVQLNAERNIMESDEPHQTPSEAQRIEYPVVVNGRIGKSGEVDYYALYVPKEEELLFEVITASGLILENSDKPLFNDPILTLYAASGSWFDPHRGIRIYPKDESVSLDLLDSQLTLGNYNIELPRLRYRFEKEGWYL